MKSSMELRRFYHKHLFDQILPFWLEKGIDSKHGGYYTGFSNSGGELLHDHKFTWSQGRFVWVWSRLSDQFRKRPDSEYFMELGRAGARFLMENALLSNGNCSFVLSRDGNPIALDEEGNIIRKISGIRYDTSTYADCFVIYGLSEYARVSGDRSAFEFSLDLYESVLERISREAFRTDPYPTPSGFRQHGVPMIMLETSRQLALTCDRFEPHLAHKIRERTGEFERQLMNRHRDGKRHIMKEFLRTDGENEENILTTYINPGHTLECMWFVIHYALEVGQREIIGPAVRVVRRALELGWDGSFGGLHQFVHMDGGRPRGPVTGIIEGHPMVEKLEENWDAKLWWVHSEALYVLILCKALRNAPWVEEWYWRVHDYTFETFPAAEGDEWINIRHRDGSPSDRVVALPVKDPFHVPRALMNAIRVLDEGVPL